MDKLTQVDIGTKFGSPFGQEGGKTTGDLISTVINTSLVVAGVIVLFMFVYAGIQMIAGAGSGKQENSEKAKQAATYAGIGFVIIFVAYWLIRLIEVITGSTFVTNPSFIK